jgi:hypothetical protein
MDVSVLLRTTNTDTYLLIKVQYVDVDAACCQQSFYHLAFNSDLRIETALCGSSGGEKERVHKSHVFTAVKNDRPNDSR